MGELVSLDEHRRRKEYLALVDQVAAERRVDRDRRNRQFLLAQLRKSGILEVKKGSGGLPHVPNEKEST